MLAHREPRSIKEIERAFREMGIPKEKRAAPPQVTESEGPEPEPQIFIRITSTTTPLKDRPNADLA